MRSCGNRRRWRHHPGPGSPGRLASEAGEVAGKVKKLIRDGGLDSVAIMHEVGDVLWYAARMCDALGFELEDVMQINYVKLTKRKDNGTIQGNGDNR